MSTFFKCINKRRHVSTYKFIRVVMRKVMNLYLENRSLKDS